MSPKEIVEAIDKLDLSPINVPLNVVFGSLEKLTDEELNEHYADLLAERKRRRELKAIDKKRVTSRLDRESRRRKDHGL